MMACSESDIVVPETCFPDAWVPPERLVSMNPPTAMCNALAYTGHMRTMLMTTCLILQGIDNENTNESS